MCPQPTDRSGTEDTNGPMDGLPAAQRPAGSGLLAFVLIAMVLGVLLNSAIATVLSVSMRSCTPRLVVRSIIKRTMILTGPPQHSTGRVDLLCIISAPASPAPRGDPGL